MGRASERLFPLLEEARACRVCAAFLPLGPRPLLAAHPESRIVIVGQAPGKAAHESGVPWKDRSGDRLREWLGVNRETFYEPRNLALAPTGFCYPGTGKGGDLAPRAECAPLWQARILAELRQVELTIYVGRYAYESALGQSYGNLSGAVEAYRTLLPDRLVLPHPSPRNGMWAASRPWFAAEVLPALRERVGAILGTGLATRRRATP